MESAAKRLELSHLWRHSGAQGFAESLYTLLDLNDVSRVKYYSFEIANPQVTSRGWEPGHASGSITTSYWLLQLIILPTAVNYLRWFCFFGRTLSRMVSGGNLRPFPVSLPQTWLESGSFIDTTAEFEAPWLYSGTRLMRQATLSGADCSQADW